MNIHALSNLLNELGGKDKMQGCAKLDLCVNCCYFLCKKLFFLFIVLFIQLWIVNV